MKGITPSHKEGCDVSLKNVSKLRSFANIFYNAIVLSLELQRFVEASALKGNRQPHCLIHTIFASLPTFH